MPILEWEFVFKHHQRPANRVTSARKLPRKAREMLETERAKSKAATNPEANPTTVLGDDKAMTEAIPFPQSPRTPRKSQPSPTELLLFHPMIAVLL